MLISGYNVKSEIFHSSNIAVINLLIVLEQTQHMVRSVGYHPSLKNYHLKEAQSSLCDAFSRALFSKGHNEYNTLV